MSFAAALFDLDGTLVDSIPLWERAYVHALQSHGLPVRMDDFLEEYQRGNMRLDTYLDDLNYEGNHDDVRIERDNEYVRLIEQELQWYSGAHELLTHLKNKGLPIGIVTGSHTHYTLAIDRRLSWSAFTDVCISIDDTDGIHKPDPKGIFMACEQLSVSPENCIYIGDQYMDQEAAHNAGMTSCIIRTPHTPSWATEKSDHATDTISQLRDILE